MKAWYDTGFSVNSMPISIAGKAVAWTNAKIEEEHRRQRAEVRTRLATRHQNSVNSGRREP